MAVVCSWWLYFLLKILFLKNGHEEQLRETMESLIREIVWIPSDSADRFRSFRRTIRIYGRRWRDYTVILRTISCMRKYKCPLRSETSNWNNGYTRGRKTTHVHAHASHASALPHLKARFCGRRDAAELRRVI